ncbi:MAG: hypothetical protein N2380_02865 [bacterium]|nr:hypothetical protein [bacterium]
MWISIIIFFAFVAIFTIGFRYTMVFATRMVAKNIEKIHRTTESILDTKLPPNEWLEKWSKKIGRLGDTPNDLTKKERLRLQAKNHSLKRLSSLIEYYKNSNLVEDEDTRFLILEELREIGRFWNKDWDKVIRF